MTTPTRVLKYRLPFLSDVTDAVDIDMPATAAPLHIAIQDDEIHMWAAVGDTKQARSERFRMYATGRPIEGSPRYLGTVHHQSCVWHVFHEPAEAPMRVELDLKFRAEFVEPGTRYEDAPAETVRPGWWVRGFNPAGNAEAEMHISGPIYDVHGDDVSERCARLLAEKLNEVNPR